MLDESTGAMSGLEQMLRTLGRYLTILIGITAPPWGGYFFAVLWWEVELGLAPYRHYSIQSERSTTRSLSALSHSVRKARSHDPRELSRSTY